MPRKKPFWVEPTKRQAKRAAERSERQAEYERYHYGTLGAASPVRRIDPKTGEVIA